MQVAEVNAGRVFVVVGEEEYQYLKCKGLYDCIDLVDWEYFQHDPDLDVQVIGTITIHPIPAK